MRKDFLLLTIAVTIFMVASVTQRSSCDALTIVGSVDTPDAAYGVYVSGSHAYVADHNGGLQVIDITAPSTPTIVGSLDVIYAHKVHVTGGYAYVAGGLILYVIDISDPQNPVLEGHTTAFARNARDLHVSGGYAYGVYDGLWSGSPFGYLKVIDVSDLQNPSVAATVSMGKGAAGVHVTGGYAYVTDGGWEGLHVIDVSDPQNPAIVGSVNVPFANKVYVTGGYAYVAAASMLYVIDVSDPKNPAIVGSVNKPQGAEDVYMSNGYAYVAAWDNDLQVFNVSNPGSPIFVSSVDTPGQATGVYVSGSYAYATANDSGLQIIELSGLTPPPSGGGGGGGGGCFIATAAYGSHMESHVKVLREFRDRFLLTNTVGRAFVDLYSTYSPPVADFIASHDNLRLMTRWSLLPVVGVSWMSLNIGPIPALIFMFLLGFGLVGIAGFSLKKLKK